MILAQQLNLEPQIEIALRVSSSIADKSRAIFQLNLHLNFSEQITFPRVIWTEKKKSFRFTKVHEVEVLLLEESIDAKKSPGLLPHL